MQLSNKQLLPVNQTQAWGALNDITVLKTCIAGCESLTETGPDQFEVVIQVSVGPVKARFKGRLALSEKAPPESYTIHFEGQGGAAGHGKGVAKVRLEAEAAQPTVLHYQVEASVGGKLAQIGQRLVDMAAQKMAADFFERFDAEMKLRYPAAADVAPAMPESSSHAASKADQWGWLSRLWARFRNLFLKAPARS